MDYNTIMALFKPRPGTVTVIRGDRVTEEQVQFCEVCKVWYVVGDHEVHNIEPVEPEIRSVK